jgi:F1F0 ATPase subunit 2
MIGEQMELVASLVLGSVVGVIVGGAFFGGLAWTVNRLGTARAPGRLVMASLVVRMAVAAVGTWAAATVGGIPAVLALVATAIGVRTILAERMTRPSPGGC